MKNTKLLLLILLAVAGIFALIYFWDLLMPFLFAAFLAYILTPLAKLLQRKLRFPKWLAVIATLLLFGAFLSLIVILIVPPIVQQAGDVVANSQKYIETFNGMIDSLKATIERWGLPPQVVGAVEGLLTSSDGLLAGFITSFFPKLVSFSLRLFDSVIMIIAMVYFMFDGGKLARSFRDALPENLRIRSVGVFHKANHIVWTYLKVRTILAFCLGVVAYIGLQLFGLPYAYLFAAVIFVFDYIPMFGSLIAGVIVVVGALVLKGWGVAIGVTIFFLVIQQIEGNIVAPKIQGDAVGIHPITLMFAVVACNRLWGPFGMLMAAPIAAIIKIVVQDVYRYVISPSDGGPPPGALGGDRPGNAGDGGETPG